MSSMNAEVLLKRFKRLSIFAMCGAGVVVVGALALSRAARAEDAVAAKVTIPPSVAREVDFKKDVEPILQTSCVTCHTSGKAEADLSLETREKLLEGGGSSPAIVPGKGADSLMIQLVSGTDPERVMPAKGKRLTPEQIGVLRAWVD